MTREQAIEVLISRYNSGVIRSRTNDDEWRLATDTVIAALSEKQQRERGCEWCNGAWETSDIDYISGVSEWDIDSMDFCPRCGRKLEDEK